MLQVHKQMPAYVNSVLASFISSTRELPNEERNQAMLSEKRKILLSNRSNADSNISNSLKEIYMAMQNYKVDTIGFIKAAESNIQKLKTLGYLGSLYINDEEYVILMINTIMKDLKFLETRNLALTAICNMKDPNGFFNQLRSYICLNSKCDPFHMKSLVAVDKLEEDINFGFVSNNENEVFVKLQLYMRKMAKSGQSKKCTENDLLFLTALFMKTQNIYLQVQLLRLFRKIDNFSALLDNPRLMAAIDSAIIPSKDRMRPQVEIALAIEAAELLLETGNRSPKIEAFVFRLIESKNPNSRFFGLRMAQKHRIHTQIAIDRSIKAGLNNQDTRAFLFSIIDTNNSKILYKRKEEIIYYMDKNGTSNIKVQDIIMEFNLKLLKHANDSTYAKIFFENPEICRKSAFDKGISKDLATKLLTRISTTPSPRYFCLIYQLLAYKTIDADTITDMFVNHLDILLQSKDYSDSLVETLEALLDAMFAYGNVERNLEVLCLKYLTLFHGNYPASFVQLFLNNINLYCSTIIQSDFTNMSTLA